MKKTILTFGSIFVAMIIIGVYIYILGGNGENTFGANLIPMQTDDRRTVTTANVGDETAMNVTVPYGSMGQQLNNPTDGSAATSSEGGTMKASKDGTLYFKITSLDDNNNETAPSSEFTGTLVGTEGTGTSTDYTVTLTPDPFASSTRLWVGTTTGVYYGYVTATSSVNIATTSSLITAATIPVSGGAYRVNAMDRWFDHYYSSSTQEVAVKSHGGYLHAITINTDAAGTVVLYDGTSKTGERCRIAELEASAPVGTYIYDVVFRTGLFLDANADIDLTISYK
jgi:hypothetical protein